MSGCSTGSPSSPNATLGLGRRLRPVDVVAQYETTILDELDLMREAASASQLRRNFEDSDLLYVPRVYWPTRDRTSW